MSARTENATLIGAGAAACAVCCAGPIPGLLATLGIGAAAGHDWSWAPPTGLTGR